MRIDEKDFREFIARTERVVNSYYHFIQSFEGKELNTAINNWDSVNILEQVKNYKEQLETPKISKWKQLKLI